MKSPCIGCDFEHDDKNNERCANCNKRIEYAAEHGMISTDGLEADKLARGETQKIRELKLPGKKRGRKLKEQKPEIKDKKPKDSLSRYGIHIRPTEFCSNIMIQEVMEGVKEIANSELRSLPQQVLWILKEQVKEWKKK